MPAHDGSRSDQEERFCPPGPERSQRDPEQLVQDSQSTPRSFGVQSPQIVATPVAFAGIKKGRVRILSRDEVARLGAHPEGIPISAST